MSKRRRLGQIAVLVFTVIGCVARAGPAPAEIKSPSIGHLAITAHERVVGFECEIHAARVVSRQFSRFT